MSQIIRNDDFPGWEVRHDPKSYAPNKSWLFLHDDCDGDEDPRYGRCYSAFACWEQIKELEQRT